MSRCTNPFGVRLSVDVPNKVVINVRVGTLVGRKYDKHKTETGTRFFKKRKKPSSEN